MKVPLEIQQGIQTKMFPNAKDLASMTIHDRAKYADHASVMNAKNLAFCQGQLAGFAEASSYGLISRTAIANCAYLALYGCPETQGDFFRLLEQATNQLRHQSEEKPPCDIL